MRYHLQLSFFLLMLCLSTSCKSTNSKEKEELNSIRQVLSHKPFAGRVPRTTAKLLCFSNGKELSIQLRDDYLPSAFSTIRHGERLVTIDNKEIPTEMLEDLRPAEIFQICTLQHAGYLVASLADYNRCLKSFSLEGWPESYCKYTKPASLRDRDFKVRISRTHNNLYISFTAVVVERQEQNKEGEWRCLAVSKFSYVKSHSGLKLIDRRDFLTMPYIDPVQTTLDTPPYITNLELMDELKAMSLPAIPLLDRPYLDTLRNDIHSN